MALNTNEAMNLAPQPTTVSLADRVRRLRGLGHRIIALQTGDPDSTTPAAIIEEGHRALKVGPAYSHSCELIGLCYAIVAADSDGERESQ